MTRFDAAGTVAGVLAIENAHANMHRELAAWDSLPEQDRSAQVIELGRPHEALRGWPLVNGAVLLEATHRAWRTEDGVEIVWEKTHSEFSVIRPDQPHTRLPCPFLSNRVEVAAAGDSLLTGNDDETTTLWVLTGDGCSFEQRGKLSQLHLPFRPRGHAVASQLGQPRASGRTAAVGAGWLMWADTNQPESYDVFSGIELGGSPHYLTDDILLIPARVEFGQDSPRDAVVLVRLPARGGKTIELALIPADALVAGDPSAIHLRMVTPITTDSNDLTFVAELAGPTGHRLVRVSLPASGPAWHVDDDVNSQDNLIAAVKAGRKAAEVTPIGPELPAETYALTVSPTGTHAAWAGPIDEDRPEQANFGIYLVELGTAGPPIQLTDNARRDSYPRFAGENGELLIFSTTNNVPDEKLPEIVSLRAVAVPRTTASTASSPRDSP